MAKIESRSREMRDERIWKKKSQLSDTNRHIIHFAFAHVASALSYLLNTHVYTTKQTHTHNIQHSCICIWCNKNVNPSHNWIALFHVFLLCFCFVCMPQIPTRGWRMLFLCCSHWAVFCILFCCIFPRWNCGNPLWDVSKAMSVNLRRVVGGVSGVHMHHCASRFIDHRGRSPYHSITHHSFHPHIDRLAVVDAKCRLLLLLGSAKAYIKLQVHRAR